MATKYPYKARQNALLSLQIYEGQGPLDIKMVSNMSDETDKLFPDPNVYDFDAKRHGRFAADFIGDHADGKTLAWLKVFFASLHHKLDQQPTKEINR